MKMPFAAVVVLGLCLLGTPELRAQGYPYYSPTWDAEYQQYLQYQHDLQWYQYLRYLQQTDPYYELHVMHYQLYLQRYQPQQIYLPCCYAFGIPQPSTRVGRLPSASRTRARPEVRRK